MELIGLTNHEISAVCERLGAPSFRAKQICDWVYGKNALSFDDMTNLSKDFRASLAASVCMTRPDVLKTDVSKDGTVKYLLGLADGETIETVLLPYSNRTSLCVSTQVGCPVNCAFCATGAGGYVRNLTCGEIVDQVLTVQRISGKRISHVVFMGMGEGLLNFNNLIKAIAVLNKEVGIAMRHLTISTVGIVPAIKRLAELNLQLTLALSLHAPTDKLRQVIIPYAKKYSVEDIIKASADYSARTGRRMTVEYLLLNDINDTDDCAYELARLMKKVFATVNLIPYNNVDGKSFTRPPSERIKRFKGILESCGVETVQRLERGGSVAGACGQLKRQSIK